MTGLIRFMQSYGGRALRVLLGLALVYVGLVAIGGVAGIVVAVIGLLPIAMGVWGPCLLGFAFKQPTHA